MKQVIINYGTELDRALAKKYLSNVFVFSTKYLVDGGIELSIVSLHTYFDEDEEDEENENDLLEKNVEHLRYLASLYHSSMKIVIKEGDET